MKFYHKGKKKNNSPSIVSGCLLIFGLACIFYLLTLLENINEIKDYAFELIIAITVVIGYLSTVFTKRGKLSNYHINIKNNFFSIEKINIPLTDIHIDVYKKNDDFKRYHLKDDKGKVAVFSVFKDDLLAYFEENLSKQITVIQQNSQKNESAFVSVLSEKQNLFYDLTTGKYTINKKKQSKVSFTPEVYTYDPKYKLGKPLLKQK